MVPWVAPVPTSNAPAGGRTLIVLYAALELGACTGLLVLCAVVAWHERLRQNAVLLNFVAVFALTSAGTSAMAWSGHASDAAPPRGLCLTTAGFAASLAVAKAGAAFSLTCKVWSQLMCGRHPRSSLFRFANSPLFLIPIPWLFGIPLFIATVVRGSLHPEMLDRNFFYCETGNLTIGYLNVCTAATLEIGSLVLAASSTYVVAGTRRRVRGAAQSVGRGAFHDSLLVRALLFNVALAGALVLELVLLVTPISLQGPIWGLSVAMIDVVAFVIIASDPVFTHTARAAFRACVPCGAGAGAPDAVSVPLHVTARGPRADRGSGTDVDGDADTTYCKPSFDTDRTGLPSSVDEHTHAKLPTSLPRAGSPKLLLPLDSTDGTEEAMLETLV